MSLDADTCYRAIRARDARFDGMFYVGVSTTGVYCRPICPARTPRRDRCTFYARPVEAERAGYRACFRCRPELAPGGASIDALPRLVREAVRRIEAGHLQDGSIEGLATDLGVTARHLRRAMEAELGVSPIELAQSRRLALAKQMLHDTRLSLTDVAFASGFSSVRRFNAVFRERFGRPPGEVRRATAGPVVAERAPITLRLDYRPPLDLEAMLGFLAGRAIDGVETVTGGVYRRTLRLGEHAGVVTVGPGRAVHSLDASISVELAPVLPQIVARLRSVFDLDARPELIATMLSSDPLLARSLAVRPGLRVAGSFDGYELGVRAILGQRISVKGARTLAGRFVSSFGEALPSSLLGGGADRLFPLPARIAALDQKKLEAIGIGRPAAAPILALSRAVASGALDLAPGADPERTAVELQAIPGIGPWTSSYIALRALRHPDAFPAGDLVLQRMMNVTTERQAEVRARAWSPWRGYAAFHLWALSLDKTELS